MLIPVADPWEGPRGLGSPYLLKNFFETAPPAPLISGSGSATEFNQQQTRTSDITRLMKVTYVYCNQKFTRRGLNGMVIYHRILLTFNGQFQG